MTELPVEPAEIPAIPVRCAYVEMRCPGELLPHPQNPNRHPPLQLQLFYKIVQYQGWRRPITVSRLSGFVTKGHGALQMALQVGFDRVPVDLQDYDSAESELADVLADNQLAALSRMDPQKLEAMLIRLDNGAFDMEVTGFDEKALERMFMRSGERPDIDLRSDSSGSAEPDNAVPADTGAEVGAEPSHVRLFQLFLNEANIEEFQRLLTSVGQRLKTDSPTATVMAVLRLA